MIALPAVFASGWASGINAYATVLILGLLGRFAHVTGIPAGFQRTDVLIVVGVLALVEFVADKIPFVDTTWDALSTVVRPVVGAAIGALYAGATGDLPTIALASVGGLTALASHAVKSGLRLAVNTSPEPLSNIAASASENVAVTGVVTLTALFPLVAAGIAGALLIVGLIALFFVASRIRRGWRAFRRWRRREAASG